jgi:hypothetical protein
MAIRLNGSGIIKNGRLNFILLDFAFGCNIGSESGFIDEIINSN